MALSSTSSSSSAPFPAGVVCRWAWHRRGTVALTLLFVLILGEAYLRAPWALPTIDDRPDRELGFTYVPNQRAFTWLARFSVQSKPITINSDGHRGQETDWSKRIVLVLGDSEVLGSGVEDRETWPYLLEQAARRSADHADVAVVNAAHEAQGPYHHYVRMKRVLEAHRVDTVILCVSMRDMTFDPVPEQGRDERLRASQWRNEVRRVSRFIPWLYNKVKVQWVSIRRALPALPGETLAADSELSVKSGEQMWQKYAVYWEKAAELAMARNVRLLFLVHDPLDSESGKLLEKNLRALADGHSAIQVYRLGADAMGLSAVPPEKRGEVVSQSLTLDYDAHPNPAQHQRIAEAVWKFLARIGW